MSEITGLLHPAFIHLPIGFVLLTIFYEWYFRRSSVALWFVTAFTALFGMISGLVLLQSGHYEGLEVFLHLVSGISVATLSVLLFLIKWQDIQLFTYQNSWLKGILALVLTLGGHLGAEITHGKDYLPFSFLPAHEEESIDLGSRDTIVLYSDIIAPIFDTKCIRCHEEGDERGKLNMQIKAGLLTDMYGDPAVSPGNLGESEIFRRISLPPSDKKYMPPSGPQLSFNEKKLIEYWIQEGATFDENLKETSPPEGIKQLLLEEYGIDFRQLSFYEKHVVSVLPESVREEIEERGFAVSSLSANTNFIEVHIKGLKSEMTEERIEILLKAKEQITWLDLSDSNLTDDLATLLGELNNLTKLKLQNTNITDGAMTIISSMPHLEVLNLYNTSVSDKSISIFSSLPKLQNLYIWQTQITQDGADQLITFRPDLEVEYGAQF